MLVSPIQYITINDELEENKKLLKIVEDKNKELHENCVRLQERVSLLEKQNMELHGKNNQIEEQLMNHIDQSSQSIRNSISEQSQNQQQFIEEMMKKFASDANVSKVKELEKKMTENRIKNHEMVDFYEKVKNLYKTWAKKKKDPTAAELYKWINDKKVDEEKNTNEIAKNILLGVAGKGKQKLGNSRVSSKKKIQNKNMLTDLTNFVNKQFVNNKRPPSNPSTPTNTRLKVRNRNQKPLIKNAGSSERRNEASLCDQDSVENAESILHHFKNDNPIKQQSVILNRLDLNGPQKRQQQPPQKFNESIINVPY